MKKVFVLALAAGLFTASAQAQDIPDRARGEFHPEHKERLVGKKELANLNLTEEQKKQMKSMREDFRKQTEDLRKQDAITVKEYRERMEKLRKDHQERFQSILTAEQKEQIKKDKDARKAKAEAAGQKRAQKMKEELSLTDDQSAKLQEMRKNNRERMQAIRDDKTLTDDQKKEQVKDILKKQKEDMKSVLTEEQMKKLQETKWQHGGRRQVAQ